MDADHCGLSVFAGSDQKIFCSVVTPEDDYSYILGCLFFGLARTIIFFGNFFVIFWLHFHFSRVLISAFAEEKQFSYYAALPLLEFCSVICGLTDQIVNLLGLFSGMIKNNSQLATAVGAFLTFCYSLPMIISLVDMLLCLQRLFAFLDFLPILYKNFKWVLLGLMVFLFPTASLITYNSLRFESRVFSQQACKWKPTGDEAFDGVGYFYLDMGLRLLTAAFNLCGYIAFTYLLRRKFNANLVSLAQRRSDLNIVYQVFPIVFVTFAFDLWPVVNFFIKFRWMYAHIWIRIVYGMSMGYVIPLSFMIVNKDKRRAFVQRTLLKKWFAGVRTRRDVSDASTHVKSRISTRSTPSATGSTATLTTL